MSHKTDGGKKASSKRQEKRLQDVWAANCEDEIARIQETVENFDHVSMDTILPGIVARPTGPFTNYGDYNYQTLKSNVDLTRALQINFTLSDSKGGRPKGISTWRFNFAFDVGRDLLGQDNMTDSSGVSLDLSRHNAQGIDAHQFGEYLMSSGLVLNDEVKWVVYSGSCRFPDRAPEEKIPGRPGGEASSTTFCGLYNFAYLLQFLTSQPLPDDYIGFNESLALFFPTRCDVAAFVQHLPPGPPLSSRDPADALRRPLFCSGHHILEAFFHMPEAVRARAFDAVEDVQVVVAGKPPKKRREPKAVPETGGAAVARAARASIEASMVGAAKTVAVN